MLYPLNQPFRENIEKITFKVEGGYMAKQKGDYETLFGLTAPNFNAKAVRAYLKEIPAKDFSQFPKVVHDELLSISEGGSPSKLMQHIGSMLQPQTKAMVKGTDTPTRTNERPRSGATKEELASINVVKDFITFHYEREYSTKFGFDKLPDNVAFKSMDIAINSGGGRATWALVKAASEAGLLSKKEFDAYPYVTSDEAADKKNFANGGKGSDYTKHAKRITTEIAHKLEDATPEQLDKMNSKMDTWRRMFFHERAKDSPYIASVLEGLKHRINQVNGVLRPNDVGVRSAPKHTDEAPIQAANAKSTSQSQAGTWQGRTYPVAEMPTPLLQTEARTAEIKKTSLTYGRVLPPPISEKSCDSTPRPVVGSTAIAAQMVAMDRGITKWANAEVAMKLPGYEGLVRYKVDQKTLKIVEMEELPRGVMWSNGKGQPAYTNQPIEEGPAPHTLTWQDEQGRLVNLLITPKLNEQLRAVSVEHMPFTGTPILPASLELDSAGLSKRASVAIDILRHKKGVDTVMVRDDTTQEKLLVSPQVHCNLPPNPRNERGGR